ncbi:MAG: ABC transporter substrate-binding protein [Bacilli bacterium]|nr:ABC transporter substrate-binding protein [Bacilli bacterium]
MKKKILEVLIGVLIIVIVLGGYFFFNNRKNNENALTKVKLSEVTHSAFYAPLYVAIEDGYFKEEGIDLELILTSGADKVAAAVLSKDVQIGFAGPESAIYVYNGGEEDYLVTFAGLTKRDGQFIVGKSGKEFDWNDLKGKEILVGRKGGMPALNFLNALKNAGINTSDVKLNYSVEFAALAGSYIAGIGDYVNLFEPNATKLEREGYGNVVASIGEKSGSVPYTAFYTQLSYFEENKEVLEKFTRALEKGIDYVKNHNEEEIATIIAPQFPDSSMNDLKTIVKRYKDYDSWLPNGFISEEIYKNLEDIMIDAELIDDYVPYDKLVRNISHE